MVAALRLLCGLIGLWLGIGAVCALVVLCSIGFSEWRSAVTWLFCWPMHLWIFWNVLRL